MRSNGDDTDDDLLAALASVVAARQSLELAERDLVTRLRARDVPWWRIARSFGVSRQAVNRRFSDCDPAARSEA